MPALTHGIGISQRMSSLSTAPPVTSAQTRTIPAKAMPMTRWPTLTGWRHEVVVDSLSSVGSCSVS